MSVTTQVYSILIAGIGNIFNGDDGFGVAVASKLASQSLPENVHAVDFGIRSFDLVLALLEGHDLTILVDTVSRGGPPGILYLIEPDVSEAADSGLIENAHGLDPVKVLAIAKQLGAPEGRVLLVGCEPAALGDETGRLGLSETVQSAVDAAIQMIWSVIIENGKEHI